MRLLLASLLIVMAKAAILAQNTIGLPVVKNYAKTEYKGGSQTWAIDQDESGRIYFGNNEGLITFDGWYWKIFPLPNRTIVRSVRVAGNGRVYVGGQGEAGYFEPGETGNLVYHSITNRIPEKSRDFADLWNIEVLGESVFFRATDRIFRYASDAVEVFQAPREWAYMEKSGNHLLAQDRQQGLFTWTGQAWQPLQNGKIAGADVFHGIINLNADSLVLVTYYNKNYLLSGGTLSRHAQITSAITSEVTVIEALNDDEYVMGTTGEGCIVMKRNGTWVQHISLTEGLQDNSIQTLFRDRQGNLWAGLNNGISLIAYNAPVKFIKPNPSKELSCYGARIYGNTLYAATNDGAYRVPMGNTPADLSFTRGSFSQVPGSFGLAYRFDEVNSQLMMAHNEGTFRIINNKAERLSADASWLFLPVGQVGPVSKVLVGNYTGMKWLQSTNGSFAAGSNLKGLRESFRFLEFDNDGQLWASHPYRGIYQISFSPDSLSYTTRLLSTQHGLPSNLDNHVFRIKNKVVFATSAGIYEYDKTAGRFLPSKLFNNIFGQMPVRYIKEDVQGNLWFVTGKSLGLVSFRPGRQPAHTITNFPEVTGRVLSGFENIFPYNERNVFVASEKGLILINPEKYLTVAEKPRVILSSVHGLGKSDSLIYNGFAAPGSNRKISLPYAFNSLHFEYSSPAYGFQENTEYSYLLEGYETTWSKWNSKREKDYTNLPNGSYTFKVKARSNLGMETEIASFSFSISPPWYKGTPAQLAYAILIAAAIYLLYYLHRKRLERQLRQFEEKQEQLRILHQLQIEQNEKEIIRLQNETLAKEVSFKNRELADTTMHLVERSDALGRVKDALNKLYKGNPGNADIKRAVHLLNEVERNNTDWDRFAASFDEINNDFLKRLKARFPDLTNNDLKLCAYLQLNMSSKEISQLLNISTRGVEISRYRLRKKLGIPTEVSISDFLNRVVDA